MRFILLIVIASLVSCKTSVPVSTPVVSAHTKYVNPFIGTAPVTDSAILGYRLPEGWRAWSGLLYPGSSLPNAMVQASPITEYGSGAGYEYEDSVIYGFTHTNKGHWNLCNIPVLPVSNNTKTVYSSRFSHAREAASPGFYQVYLEDYKVQVDLTSTLRTAYHRYTYNYNNNQIILFDLGRANNRVRSWDIRQQGTNVLEGHQDSGEGSIYFYAVLNVPVRQTEKKNEDPKKGHALVHLENGSNKPVEMKIGFSYVSVANAKRNLEQEVGEQSFSEVRKAANDTWEQLLSRIKVEGGTAKQKEMFYSSLYRGFLWPALRSDVGGDYTDVKNNVVNNNFRYYTVPSLWDTYRNKEVLATIVTPDVSLDVIRSLKDMGDKTGFIPTFFHGDHAAPYIVGSYKRGLKDFDVEGTYQLLLRNASVEGGSRPHINEYMKKGYISDLVVEKPWVESKSTAGVSKTLEYAYDDYSVALMAKMLGDTSNHRIFMQRARNYRNVFDASTRFMRGRLPNGEWVPNFDPQYPYYEYMYREANAWQVSFFAPHDMPGLIELYGGPKGFESKLDSFYTLPWNPTHIARNVESMIGQYCHGNQPDHEAPFAYHFIGKPEKSQRIIDTILNTLYGIGEQGLALCGMDDAGEMSSWYVFASLGVYPFSPADDEYIVSVPLFDKTTWTLTNGKTLTILKNGKGRRMTGIHVNGAPITGYFIPHSLFENGGTLEILTTE